MRSANASKEHLIEVSTRVFAREGFAGTSLRMIAVEAGVSAALLVHHFGSKQHLIEQAIEIALGQWMKEKDHLSELPLSEALSEWPKTAKDGEQKLEFFKQVMLSGGRPAEVLLERMHLEARERLILLSKSGATREFTDIDTTALLLATYAMAPLILSDSVKKILGGDLTEAAISEKLARSSMEILAIFKEGPGPSDNKKGAGEK
jgi:AcrR family transcriptional regulator